MGIPVIARNTTFISKSCANKDLLFNDYNEIEKLITNTKNNLKYYSDKACEYIVNKYTNNENLDKMINVIQFIEYTNDCLKKNIIPNIVHFIFGLKEQT